MHEDKKPEEPSGGGEGLGDEKRPGGAGVGDGKGGGEDERGKPEEARGGFRGRAVNNGRREERGEKRREREAKGGADGEPGGVWRLPEAKHIGGAVGEPEGGGDAGGGDKRPGA